MSVIKVRCTFFIHRAHVNVYLSEFLWLNYFQKYNFIEYFYLVVIGYTVIDTELQDTIL